jgi:excisionase family DNA binding protein
MEAVETKETRDSSLVPPLMTIKECAELARVSRSHIWKRIRAGQIPAVRVGERTGPIRVPTGAFLHWLYDAPSTDETHPLTPADLAPWVEMPEVFDAAV